MQYKQMGRTGLKVSAMSIGTMFFGTQVNEEEAIKTLDLAFEKGINMFDTADAYGLGKSEEIVGKAITTSYHKRLAYLEGKSIITLVDYAKKNKLSHSNLINKAQRQTIEAFLEKGVWKIGI